LTENRDSHSSRRRFVRWLATVGAAGGIGALLSERAAEKPLIQLAQAASGEYLSMDNVNTAAGTTELDSDLTTSGTDAAFKVVASATSGTMRGMYAESPSPDGRGVEGYASASVSESGNAAGVYGHTIAPNTAGVRGIATASSSRTYAEAGGAGRYTAGVEGYAPGGIDGPVQGVYGHSDSMEGCGVWGVATATSGEGCGVAGYSESPDGAGVLGRHWSPTGWAAGVAGLSKSPDGYGVWGRATATTGYDGDFGPTAYGTGVGGRTDSPDGTGVWGRAYATTGYGTGVWGRADSPDGTGAGGIAAATTGYGTGVWGATESPDGIGAGGVAKATTGYGVGVLGRSKSPDGQGVVGVSVLSGYEEGVFYSGTGVGVYGKSHAYSGKGVQGWAAATSGYAVGVYGESLSPLGIGVQGVDLAADYGNAGVAGLSRLGAGVQGDAREGNGIGVIGRAGGPTVRPIVAQASSGQTAALQEWQRSDRTVLTAIDKNGWLGLGTSAPARMLHLRGTNAVARMDRNDSPAFMLVRTSPNFNTVWKCFVFGAQATGVNNGSFYIADMGTNVGGAGTYRLFIDNTGNFGIGNTTPTVKLHVSGRVKATGYDTGDITYANGIKTTEEGSGLAFLNDAGEKIAILDREGNFHIKGKFVEDL
jgi:hypothetical protein